MAAPLGTVTEDGTETPALLLESDTTTPVPPAVWFKVTVHEAVPGVSNAVGLQLRLVMLSGTGVLTLPPVPVRIRLVPRGDAATVLVTLIGMVPEAVDVRVTFRTATAPF